MDFSNWLESSSNELFNSSVQAFPNTQAREHLVDTINIKELAYTPFLGVKTLFVKCVAENAGKGTEYKPMILFKGVNYDPQDNKVKIVSGGQEYTLEQFSQENSQILVKCQCPDFRYRFGYYCSLENPTALYGKVAPKYEGQGLWKANPQELPGMCKHLMALVKNLQDNQIIN